jgi:threonine dehydratase
VAISGGVRRTESFKSFFLSELIGANVYLKPEVQQFTGSFKERGARNAILKLKRDKGSSLKGVIAASAGNHALAMAYHGKELGVPVTVVMPVVAPLAKVDKCRKFGARVIIEGAHILEAKTFADTLVAKEELTYVNGYDDPAIISGAGTIGEFVFPCFAYRFPSCAPWSRLSNYSMRFISQGIEILEDCPEVDVVVVPVGGAGLIAGVACAVKTLKPECKVRDDIHVAS